VQYDHLNQDDGERVLPEWNEDATHDHNHQRFSLILSVQIAKLRNTLDRLRIRIL